MLNFVNLAKTALFQRFVEIPHFGILPFLMPSQESAIYF